jgi:hypothetical protein
MGAAKTTRRFHAKAVEAYSDIDGVLTVHFDDTGGHYLQLQAPAEGYEEEYGDLGMVYVEVDDQGTSAYDCFSFAELKRGSFRIVFSRTSKLADLGEVEVTFDLVDQPFRELRDALGMIFRLTESPSIRLP